MMTNPLFKLFKKKTREEQVQYRASSILISLLSTADFEFTDLETVQVLNCVKQKLSDHLAAKRSMLIEQSIIHTQTASEIQNALACIE